MNKTVELAPVEHRVTFLGQDPTIASPGVCGGEWRIRCECGWTEKVHSSQFGTDVRRRQRARVTLMLRWERHVYTPEQRAILAQLEGEKDETFFSDY